MKFMVCPSCGAAHTATAEGAADGGPDAGMRIRTKPDAGYVSTTTASTVKSIARTRSPRVPSGLTEFDRLLDGGFVDGQVVLIGAAPGFGKSTLAIEILESLAERGASCLYASGEESQEQLAERAVRVGSVNDNVRILSTSVVEDVLHHTDALDAGYVVVDSLQTMASAAVDGLIGGVAQSKESAMAFTRYAKANHVVFILVSQFTKNDEVAGSNQIAHIVDTVLIGDSDDETRLKFLRSEKNRYGRTGETAIFVHESDGIKSVDDPSEYLMGDMSDPVPGAARTCVSDGSRMLPIEFDALVVDAVYGSPQRQFNGFNPSRGKILVAALTKYVRELKLGERDVFVNALAGVRAVDPNADLGVAAAVASSALDQAQRSRTMWVGEVTLTGMVVGRGLIESKAREAMRLGFERIVIPKSAMSPALGSLGIEVRPISRLSDITTVL